jgi:hypothetical protein
MHLQVYGRHYGPDLTRFLYQHQHQLLQPMTA